MKLWLYIILAAIVLSGCKKEDEIIDLDSEFIDFGSCYLEFRISEDFLIINDSATYADLEKALRNPWNPLDFTDSCGSTHLPKVNFANNFVVGKKTSGQGCNASYSRKVRYNKTQKKYLYTIDVKYSGDCTLPKINSYNWAIVPKQSGAVGIDFDVKP